MPIAVDEIEIRIEPAPLRLPSPAPCPAVHAAAAEATVVSPRGQSALAVLLTGHILQDGETIVLALKPSFWYILLSSIRFVAIVLIGMIAVALLDGRLENFLPYRRSVYQEIGLFLLAGRIMWATLQWMGRLYILTDLRIIRVSGVFSIDVFDCPLRKLARTRLLRPMRERVLRLGTIEIVSSDAAHPSVNWNTVARPIEVHETIVATIQKQNCNF